MGLIVGIDVGVKSKHDALLIRRETSRQVGKGIRFGNTCEGRDTLFKYLGKVCEENETIEFVIDSPGKAWIPLAAMIKAKGYRVYRPTAIRFTKMRQAGDRKNKTNRIDALALARCLLSFPEDTEEVFLPQGIQVTLDHLVRQRDRVVDQIRRRKQRVQDLTIGICPTLMTAMGDFALSQAGRAFLRVYLDPAKVVKLGHKRLYRFLEKNHRQNVKPEKAEAIFIACQDAKGFYDPIQDQGLMPIDVGCVQEDMTWEMDSLERDESHLLTLETKIKQINQKLDPSDSFISMPGVRHILAGSIRSCIGDIDRFPSLTKHRGFVGFYPSSKGTGDSPSAKGTRMSKMASARYRRYLFLAADNAYKWDVEMAAFYHKRRRGGHTHTQAVCAVANGKLLPRIHHLLKELKKAQPNHVRPQYVFRDLSGNPISKAEAKAIIQAKWGGVNY